MKHHYLPVFYLKSWAHPGTKKLTEFTRFDGKVKAIRRAPAGAGWETDLYRIPGAPSESEHIFESGFLARVDDRASLALRGFLAGADVPNPDKTVWIQFLISLMARSPSSLATLKDHAGKFIAENCEDVSIPSSTAYTSANVMALQVVKNVILDPKVINLIAGMYWFCLMLDDRAPLLMTSDRPVLTTNGLKRRDGQIILPLAPNAAFFAFYNQDEAKRVQQADPANVAKVINMWTVSQAVKHVYSRDDAALRFVDKRMGSAKKELYVDYQKAASSVDL